MSNRVLYSDEIYYLDFIEDNLGLELHTITALDLCLDLSCDVALIHISCLFFSFQKEESPARQEWYRCKHPVLSGA